MNALHLLWIVPMCIFAGYAVCCILTIGRQADERMDEIMRREQTQEDLNKALSKCLPMDMDTTIRQLENVLATVKRINDLNKAKEVQK
jgi:hypothetical protein